MGRTRSRWGVAVATVLVPLLAVTGVGAGIPASADWAPADPEDPATPVTVTADALPTVQIGGSEPGGGVVWSQAVAGDTVYAGGEFETAQDPEAATTEVRDNLVAYDVTTGVMTGFAPSFNGTIRAVAVSPDESRLYVGGAFTQVDGEPRSRIAAFDLPSGDLVDGFSPQISGTVQALAVTDATVYAGGAFGGVGNQSRGNLAAFDASGTLLNWAPTVSGGAVDALAVKPDGTRIAAGGMFMEVNGDEGENDDPEAAEPGDGLALFDDNGTAMPLAAGEHLYTGNGEDDADGAITALAADDEGFYGTGYTYASIDAGTVEGTFAVNWDGTTHWIADCHGDSYSVHPGEEQVYVAGHTHYCENMGGVTQGAGGVGDYPYYRGVAYSRATTGVATWEPDQRRYYNFEGQPTPSLLTWYPSLNAGTFTGQFQGPWSVTGNDDYVAMGGEFTRVNGQAQQGLVRFARADLVPEKGEGPTRFNDSYPLQVSSTEPGTVRLGWATNEDIDNANLEYRLQRRVPGGNSSLLDSWSKRADFWDPLGMTHTDRDVAPGDYEYRIQSRDPSGLTANSSWTPVTVTDDGSVSAYVDAVHNDEPTHWWRFGEASGSTTPVEDEVSSNSLDAGAGVVRGTQGAVGGDTSNRGASFPGSEAGVATSTVQDSPPDLFTLEAWFRTTSTSGGRIVSRDTGSGFRAKADRVLYLDEAGKVGFGVKPDADLATIASPGSYHDGEWHHVAGVLSADGMTLYVDGAQVAQNADVTVGEHLAIGYWKVGGGSAVTGLPGAFAGDLDEVAVYKHALSPARISAHVAAAGAVSPNEPPTAAIAEPGVDELTASLDASGSTDSDGEVASYRWTFGDGMSETSAESTLSHTYENAGTYTVSLTVIDDRGRASAPVTRTVTVIDSTNQAPAADFGASGVGLRPTFDAAPSSDPDGTVIGWQWDFGNGRTSGSQAPRGRFDTAGTYPVTLTVTDNDGAADTMVRNVTVSEDAEPVLSDPIEPNSPPTAAFTHTVTDLSVAFGQSSTDADGEVVEWAWDFGDGTGSTEENPTHTYTEAGTYPVTLTVTDDDGATSTHTVDVEVEAPPNQAPIAGFDSAVDELKVSLTSTSTDADGTIASQEWDFGDGATGSGAEVEHTYAEAGTYQVALTVTDDDGATSTYTTEVAVDMPVPNEPPTVGFDSAVDELKVSLTSTSTDADGTIASQEWDFGDGATGSGPEVEHTYDEAGTYQVALTVTDDDGAVSTTTVGVTVTAPPALNEPPVAGFEIDVESLSVSLTSTSTDPDGRIASQEWDFGDGATGSGPEVEHSYAKPGTYTVTLTVTDDDGAESTHTAELAVTKPKPKPNKPPTASFGASMRGVDLTLRSRATDPDGRIRAVRWWLGDGTTARGHRVEHTYPRAGRYRVRMQVIDERGARANTANAVRVRKVAVRTGLRVKPRKVRRGKRVAIVVRIRPVVPTAFRGRVLVKDRGRIVRKRWVRRAAVQRTAPVRIRMRPSVGRHRIKVVLRGTPVTERSASKVVVLKVRRR